MPCWGSQLVVRALRCQRPTDQKWMWSVSRQNTRRNHFKEAWIMDEALRSCSGLAVLTCHRWSVPGISGGLVEPSCCVARGYVSWAAGRREDWKQACISSSGCSGASRIGLHRADRGCKRGIKRNSLLFVLMQTSLYDFRQEGLWAAVAPFQELIRTWNRAQALNTLYLRSEWRLFLLL